jgi:VIT1/CCC1 family predicted Fe2+/Mn2+ transporter
MKTMQLTEDVRQQLLAIQRTEITEHEIYLRLARALPESDNRRLLERIAADELRHYHIWRGYTQQDVAPNRFQVWRYHLISRVLGLTFGIKLMERGEAGAQDNYAGLRTVLPEAETIGREENQHEQELIGMLDEERLRYIGSIVLGLNDALVELTGALAGLTLALQNTRLIALTGLITGLAAALSMGASEFLSTRSEENSKSPRRAAVYTTTAYIATVFALIAPYLLLQNYFVCLACSLGVAVLIIAMFNYYISVAKDEPFRRRFLEMAGLSFGVAAFSFLVGFLIRHLLGVEV